MNFIIERKIFCLINALAIIFTTVLSVFAQTAGQPVAPVREVTDDYFGTMVSDPYRWMEEPKSAELAEWMKAQAAFTRAFFDRIPLRAKFLKELEEQSSAVVRVSGVQRVGNLYFYFKLAPGDTDRKVYVREGLGGQERLLIDPQKTSAAQEKRFSILAFSPSQDGKLVSYLAAAGGSELGEIRIVETETGRVLDDRIERSRWEAGAWLPDGRSFLYVSFPNINDDQPQTERYQKRTVYLHTLGTSAENDKPVFGYEVNPNIKLDPKLLPFPSIPFGSKYAFISLNSGVSPNSAIYIAPTTALGESTIPWKRIIDFSDEVGAVYANGAVVNGDDIYLLTYKGAPRYRVVRTSLKNPDVTKAETIVPAGEAISQTLVAARDALYIQQNDGGIKRIVRYDYKTKLVEKPRLPFEGEVFNLTADPRESGALFGIYSWVKSHALFAFDAASKTITDTKLQTPSPLDTSQFESVEVKVKSHDGAMVPLSIVYKKGLKLDGKNPTAMTGYGAYGISNQPAFVAPFIPWLKAGGVIAFAHVRGGGEYGEEWHMAGFQKTKPNTWKDFIACAEYLIREKYTSPEHLAGHGASAGGILIGNAIAKRPDLFGAAIIQVGLNNMLRYETTANGVPNMPEFGSVKTEEGFKNLLAMDAYQKVKDGVKYPAVLLTHGINDPRVEPWFSAKLAARLQAATTSGKPVLLRIDYDAGHGIGNSPRQFNEEFADMLAFLFQQLG